MNALLKYGIAAAAMFASAHAGAEVVLYEHANFDGRSFTADNQIDDLRDQRGSRNHRNSRRDDRHDNRRSNRNDSRYGFNDLASSVIVFQDRWEVCDAADYRGRCVVLRPGRYPSLSAMGLNDRVSSVRIVDRDARFDDDRYAPEVAPVYDNRRRNNERLYEANVTSVREVIGTPEQRCWIESEQVSNRRPSVPGAIIGAVIGGVLGHQVGDGRGNDIATVGGAVAGAAVGSQVNRGRNQSSSRDVERCEQTSHRGTPDYWDVTYNFRNVQHRIQMTNPPGRTITVNRDGEPRA